MWLAEHAGEAGLGSKGVSKRGQGGNNMPACLHSGLRAHRDLALAVGVEQDVGGLEVVVDHTAGGRGQK